MPFLILSAVLLFSAYAVVGTEAALWILLGSQLALLGGQIARRQLTGVGGFVFLSILFFGVRPLYLFFERDTNLLQKYLIRADISDIGITMWWGTLALWCFCCGATLMPVLMRGYLRKRRANSALSAIRPIVSNATALQLLAAQVITLPIMMVLARGGRSIYGSAFGAYAYDLPVPLQAVHVFAVVVILERVLRNRNGGTLIMLVVSSALFLAFTWLMREVSSFRGFYLAGVMIVGIAVLMRLKGRVGYAWLIIPVVALQPLFQYLGAQRGMTNQELANVDLVDDVIGGRTLAETYWQFYDSGGDINIFDTFVAAYKYEPRWYPYAWTWLYVPLHFVPRALWEGKPKRGVTMDVACTKGLPTSPGIAGFFLLDGGLVWMLLSMTLLGYLVSWLDWYILTMRAGYLQACLIGIVTINGMFLSRVFLWQYFYGILYAVIPCIILAWYTGRSANRMQASARRASGARSVGVFRGDSA
jgi:hypothetical protein